MVGPKLPLVDGAANEGFESVLTDVAGRTNVRTSGRVQKRDKIKVSFAEDLCHKNIQ